MSIQEPTSVYSDDFLIENDESKEKDPYIIYDITSYPSDFTLQGIVDARERGDIVIPDFQREFVWTKKQSSLLIESFLIGLPVPPVFFFIDEDQKVLVIDGQQRIMSIWYYFKGYFPSSGKRSEPRAFKLSGLHKKSPYRNKQFSDLDDTTKRTLQNIRILRAINIQQQNPSSDKSSAYHIFERLNTLGTPLKSQEIRNVVYRGEFASTLKILNRNPEWRSILGQNDVNRHYSDVELVLRLFALSAQDNEYDSPMKQYLNNAMGNHQNGNTPEVYAFTTKFPRVCMIIVETLGKKPFHIRGPINTALLDCVFVTIYKNVDCLPEDLGHRFNRLTKDEDLKNYTMMATGDKNNVISRLKKSREILIES